jgi:hypothetical protein
MLDQQSLPKVDAGLVNILIAMPCYGSQVYVQHTRSLRGLTDRFRAYGTRFTIAETITESLIPRARNAFANICCFDGDANGRDFTHILFLDVDIGFNPDNIIEAIGWDKDIVALPYPCKTINWDYIVQAVKKGVENPVVLARMGSRPIVNTNGPVPSFNCSEPIEFPQLGTGLLLIKREVLEGMTKQEWRRYKLMEGEKIPSVRTPQRDYAYDFFQIGINKDTKYYDSEDYRFCLDARELGFQTWLLPWAVTSHTGMMDFWMDIPAQAAVGIPPPDNPIPSNGFVPLTI